MQMSLNEAGQLQHSFEFVESQDAAVGYATTMPWSLLEKLSF